MNHRKLSKRSVHVQRPRFQALQVLQDQQFEMHSISILFVTPLWPFTPCHLQSRRPTLPWRKQNSNLDHLVNSWTSNAASRDTLAHLPLQVDSEKNSFSFGKSDTRRHEPCSENGWCVDIIWIMLYDGSNDLLEPLLFARYLDLAVA
jgi:hypothetical protein